jgi:sugar phosphate isomerase/epimerase
MQLAAITDEISQDFEHALDVMLEYGATGAELRGLWGTNIADLTDEQVTRAQTALRERQMRVVGLATPFFKCDLAYDTPNEGEAAGRMHLATPRGLEQQMGMLRRCIQLAHTFETPLIRVFSFWRKAALTPALEERIVQAFAEPVALAEKEGIILGLENEHACFIGTGAEAARIASAVNSPNFRIVWDPGNAFHAGEIPFPEGYEAVKPWMTHMHIKDARIVETPDHGPQPKWCVVGEGNIDYIGQFAALKRDGYAGYISLETHYVPATGSGENGKGTPEDGSRPCLAALRRFLSAS